MTDRAERILDEIRTLSPSERSELVARVLHELPIGLFADEPELMELVNAEALAARERDPLRVARPASAE